MTTRTSRGGRRTQITLAFAAFVAGFVALSPPASTADATNPRPAQAVDEARLELVGQQFATDPNGNVELRYLLSGLDGDPLQLIPPPTTPPTDPTTDPAAPIEPPVEPEPEPEIPELATLTMEVTNYPPLTDPGDVGPLVGSDVDPDAFRRIAGDAVDGVALDARPLLERNDDGTVNLTLDIGTDVVDSIETRLKMDRPGMYPLRIQLVVGDRRERNVVATAGTVVQRLAGADDTDVEVAPPIDLAVIAVTPAPPPRADAATVDLARARLDESIDLAARVDVPVTLEVPPPLIADAAATPSGSERLAAALDGDELVALPLLPLDVSSAVRAGRADAYTRMVRAGEDVLTEAVPTTPSRRDVWITTDPLSSGGAQQLRDLGTRFVVIGAELYADTISDDLPPTDRFVEAELPDGGTLPFLVVDPLSEQLTSAAADRILAGSTSFEWGVETLAEMLVEQFDEDTSAAASAARPTAPPRRSMVLTTPDLTRPDPRLVQVLSELAATTPSVRFTAASALTGVTDVALDDGEPVTVQLPDVAGPSLEARIGLLDTTALELASAASMLPPDDPRPAEWTAELDSLISTGYTDADVEAATAELLAEADELRQAVQLPEPFTFTLTGRSGTIEVRIGNTLDEPLDVVIALDSTKVTFPEGDQRVTLRPLDETSVIVPVEAESNGTSSINLVVATPAGEALGEPVTLTARVTALTGLGQVLTGGFVLVLLTWWFTHWRNRRRAELAGDGRERHPSKGPVQSDGPVTDPINPPADVAVPSVHVVTDSSCDLPADIAHDLDISIVPLAIRFGDERFIDREELSTAEFWTRCVNSDTLPETAAPAPGQFEQTYRSAAAKGATGIVVVTLSSALSATMQSAQLAARAIADDPTIDLDVRVIDSRTISMGLGTIALACARAARDGAGIDEIETLAIDLVGRTRVYGALDTLENLKKGGRIGNAKALLATALSIKPIIEVTGGVVEQAGKQRTRSKALAHLVDTVKKFQGNIENLAVLHADCSDVDLFVEMLAPYYTDEIVIGEIGPVIGTHSGRGTIGVAFQVTTP